MTCTVEYTDEFESWWNKLNEEEQISVAASVGLLEENTAYIYAFPIAAKSKAPNSDKCANYASNIKASPIAYYTPLTHCETPYSYLVATKQATTAGMKSTSSSPNNYLNPTYKH
ncbi:hypothetical protein MIS31_10590 [Wielerella bovis]|nr:hypothetical protein [Wielerella bovis]ULJ66679.1 hypothetical protein MIS31_10590 [Wielerella bovis]